eukprot:XP_027303173.1 uncharacterized protein LOC113840642 [Anas platyrhynchos]
MVGDAMRLTGYVADPPKSTGNDEYLAQYQCDDGGDKEKPRRSKERDLISKENVLYGKESSEPAIAERCQGRKDKTKNTEKEHYQSKREHAPSEEKESQKAGPSSKRRCSRAWKLLSKSVTSRSAGREAGADLSLVKETALRMAEEQSNIQGTDLAAEEDQNKVAIDISDPKGKEVGAEKDTIEMKHGDGKDVAITMITIHLMRQETVERESPLTAMQPLTNGLQLTTAGHISIIITKVDGLTVPA